jgi:hypothetical protein
VRELAAIRGPLVGGFSTARHLFECLRENRPPRRSLERRSEPTLDPAIRENGRFRAGTSNLTFLSTGANLCLASETTGATTARTDRTMTDDLIQTVTARDAGLTTLYRYMAYPPLSDQSQFAKDRRKWVEELLGDGILYSPLSREFNDPFETAPHFRIPRRPCGSIDSDVYIRALRAVYGPKWGWSPERIDQAEHDLLEKIRMGIFEAETAVVEATWSNRLRNEFPICSMSSDPANVPMWSYYASSHTGVCVHIDAMIAPFGTAFRVVYQDVYPFLPQPIAGAPPTFVIQQCLLIKSKAWEHEKEYRFIDLPNLEGRGRPILDPPVTRGRIDLNRVQLRDQHIIGLSCGCWMQSDAIERLARICGERRSPIHLRQAKTAKYRFDLTFEEIRG